MISSSMVSCGTFQVYSKAFNLKIFIICLYGPLINPLEKYLLANDQYNVRLVFMIDSGSTLQLKAAKKQW